MTPINYFERSTRGYKFKIRRELLKGSSKFNTNRHNFFTNRIANNWNSLSEDVVESKNINEFKNNIDKFFNF